MGRQLRIEYEDAFYYVMANGNGFQWIYKNEEHINLFKNLIKQITQKYKVKIHAVVLMRNHYHILIETPQSNLSKCMKIANVSVTRQRYYRIKKKIKEEHIFRNEIIEIEEKCLNC